MKKVRILCLVAVLLMTGLSVSAQQMPWKGSLDNLGEFTGVVNLSDREVARRVLMASLSDPDIQLESVSIHVYTRADACQEAFLWRRLANNYGALSLVFDGDDSIRKEWFDELDDACDPNAQASAEPGDPVRCILTDNWSNGNAGEADGQACNIAWILGGFVAKTEDIVEGANQFIYTTVPLPYATSLVELRGLCDTTAHSPDNNNSACSRKLSLR